MLSRLGLELSCIAQNEDDDKIEGRGRECERDSRRASALALLDLSWLSATPLGTPPQTSPRVRVFSSPQKWKSLDTEPSSSQSPRLHTS